MCILCALILLMQGIVVQSMLEEPEYYAPDIMITESGEVSYVGEMEPNPNYIPEGSRKRAVAPVYSLPSQGDQELKNAVTNIAHDLRTPLHGSYKMDTIRCKPRLSVRRGFLYDRDAA